MEEQLREYGLSDKEAKVYLACLKAGVCTANKISTLTDLRRSTTYDVLESLKSKGIVSSFIKDKKYYFQVAEPSELIVLLKEKESMMKKILPELEKMKGTSREETKIELYEGMKGIITLLEYIYNEKEILTYGSACRTSEVLKHLPKSLAYKRVEEKIILKAVFSKSKHATFRITDPEIKKVTEMRFLEEMKYFPSVTLIAGNHVAIIKLEDELVGIHIVDSKMAKTQRLIFENYWKQAKRE